MKATEQYFPVVLFIMLYKMVLTFESVDEIPRCDHLNESYLKYFSVVLFIMLFVIRYSTKNNSESSLVWNLAKREKRFNFQCYISLSVNCKKSFLKPNKIQNNNNNLKKNDCAMFLFYLISKRQKRKHYI